MKLANRHASIEVQSMGAMICSAVFHLGDGRTVSPFFRAPWKGVDDPRKAALPPLLRDLGAEWVCVPFGGPGARADLPSDWQPDPAIVDWDGHPHGLSSNHDWQLAKLGTGTLRAEILYPPETPIVRLVREIWLDPRSTCFAVIADDPCAQRLPGSGRVASGFRSDWLNAGICIPRNSAGIQGLDVPNRCGTQPKPASARPACGRFHRARDESRACGHPPRSV